MNVWRNSPSKENFKYAITPSHWRLGSNNVYAPLLSQYYWPDELVNMLANGYFPPPLSLMYIMPLGLLSKDYQNVLLWCLRGYYF